MTKIEKYHDSFIEKVSRVDLVDTLYVIWGYIRNLQFDKEVPREISIPPNYNMNASAIEKRLNGVLENEFEILLLYSILFSAKEIYTRYSFRNFKKLSSAINDIRLIRDEIDSILGEDHENVWREFFRNIHNQFLWQEKLNLTYTYRFYKIFSHPLIEELIKQKINLTTKQLYHSGLLMTGYFMNNFYSKLPIKSKVNEIPTEELNQLVIAYSIDSSSVVKEYKDKVKVDEQFLYNFNPLRSHPLLIHKNKLYCPIPNYLYWKVTNGIYYEIVDNKNFGNALGDSFEKYCGKVLRKTLTSTFEITPEIKYGKSEKRTADWILKEKNSFLFIECKASRLKLGSKTKLFKTEEIEKDIERMADCVFQVYKSLNDVLNGKVEKLVLNENSRIYITIITLEEWFITLNPIYDNQIRILASEKLEANGICKTIMKFPFYINSVSRFEEQTQVISKFGIEKYYDTLAENKIQELHDKVKILDLFHSECEEEILDIKKKN